MVNLLIPFGVLHPKESEWLLSLFGGREWTWHLSEGCASYMSIAQD